MDIVRGRRRRRSPPKQRPVKVRGDTYARLYGFDRQCFILDSVARLSGFAAAATRDYPMTYLDIVFRYGASPGENQLRAIDGMREVYGIRGVKFSESDRTVRVGFDASRLKADTVARLLRQAGVDVRERLERV